MAELKNIAAKMVKIMGETKRVAKNGQNTFQNYAYVTEADVMDSVREIFVKHNVFLFSSVIGTDKNSETNITSVVMEHTFVDADSGEEFKVKSFGQGQDKGDKGGNKAITAAVKYLLLKNLLLSTGDDPEATDETGKSTGPKAVKLVNLDTASNTGGTQGSNVQTKKYGFSGKSKAGANAPSGDAPTQVAGADEF
jgi:hypothetical protein